MSIEPDPPQQQSTDPAATPQQVQRLRHRPPGLPREALRRGRLDALLDSLFEKSPVVMITAASGSGKTVQAQLYAETTGLPGAWITLDASHASPPRLLASIHEALRPHQSAEAQGAARAAFRMDATVSEIAAVAAGTISRDPALLVVDECEHLAGSDDAQSALETFIRYCPDTLRILLLSTVAPSGRLQRRMLDSTLGLLEDLDLRLTTAESEELAGLLQVDDRDVQAIHDATGGWMAGTVFGVRYGLFEQSPTMDLPSQIMSEVLAQLPEEEQQFLVDTSIPEAVTRPAAVALCGDDGHRLWDALRTRQLPATTTTETTIVYHSLFRGFLRKQLLARDPQRHVELARRYAAHLGGRGYHQDATELYLSVDAVEEAVASAEHAVGDLCNRSDWDTIVRWTGLLGNERVEAHPPLLAGLIRALFGLRRFEETLELIRRMDQSGRLRGAMEADPALLATAAWAMQGEVAEARRLLDRYKGDFRADVVRFMIQVCSDTTPAVPPVGTDWGDVERIISWGFLLQGRVNELRKFIPADPNAPVLNPNVVFAAILSGDLAEARDLLERVPPEIRDRPHTHFMEGMLHITEYEFERALASLEVAITESRSTSFFLSPAYEIQYGWVLFRLGRQQDAISTIEKCIQNDAAAGRTALMEWGQALLGCFLLNDNQAAPAHAVLEECVSSMKASQRRLFLPFAAGLLSEARARLGDLDGAHEAADLAYHSAAMMGCLSMLIPILQRFPAIAVREDKRDPAERRWRRVIATPSARPVKRGPTQGVVHLGLQPFGPDRDILVDGEPQGIGRLKIIELTALLVLHPNGIERTHLQSELFPEATLKNGGNHFRQISFKFRQITGLSLDRRSGNLIGLPTDTVVEAADMRFEELAKAASKVTGEERIHRLRSALSLISGPYLHGSNLAWAEDRRNHLLVVEEEARLELVNMLIDLDRYDAARTEVEALLSLNQYSDPGYRLLVRIEKRAGSESSVMAAYRRAVTALEELGLQPGDARKLLETPSGDR